MDFYQYCDRDNFQAHHDVLVVRDITLFDVRMPTVAQS